MYKSDINLNLYKAFYEVAKCKNISEAAKINFTSQSALSKAIKKLEDELETQLFYRNLNGVELTEKGRELFYYVDGAFNNLITGERAMLEDSNLLKGKVAIGVPSQIGTFFLFQNILEFHQKHPNIEITLISKGTKELLSLLENHEIDFMIDSAPIETKSLNITKEIIHSVDNVFVCSTKFYEDNKVNIFEVKDIALYPLILPIPGTANRRELDKYFIEHKVSLDNVINIHTSEMMISAINNGLGIGYVIYDLVKDDIDNGNLKLISLDELPKVDIELVYIKKYLTDAPVQFIKTYIKSNIDEEINEE